MRHEIVHTIWLGLRVTHPADWEPSRLVLDPAHARCVLIDRTHQRMDIHWRPRPVEPDLKKMLAHQRRSVGTSRTDDFTGSPDWEGFIRKPDESAGGHTVTQVSRYFEQARWLVELAIIWPGPRDKALERRILAGVAPEPLEAAQRRWQALGLSVAVPRGTPMKSYLAQPGHIRFDYQTKQGKLSIGRLAMVEHWLKQPLETWLLSQAGDDARQEEGGPCQVNGHLGQELLASRPAPALERLVGRRQWQYRKAWICPENGRLHVVEWTSTGRSARPAPPVEVGCCHALSEPLETP